MSWTEATFKNRSGKRQRVWVRTDDEGELVVEEGRVEMKYQIDDDAKIYNAAVRNVDTGGEGSGDEESSPEKRKEKKKKEKKEPVSYDDDVWKAPVGERVVANGEPPAELRDLAPPPEGVVEAWTDGACTGNPGPCGFGVVLRAGDEYIEIGQFLGVGTNNIAELDAIRVALEEGRNIDGRFQIHTDSNYAIGVLTRGWKAKANVELIHTIRALIAEYDPKPKFVKVKGHAGIPLNERADTLAVEAVERRK